MKKMLYRPLVASFVLGFLLLPRLYAQSLEQVPITVSIQQQSLPAIFAALQERYPFQIYYQTQDLPDQLYDLQVEKVPLAQVFQQLLAATALDFLVYRDYAVVIAPRAVLGETYSAAYYTALEQSLRAPEPQENQPLIIGDIRKLRPSALAKVRGRLLTQDTQEPVVGATILVKDRNKGAASDENGGFELELPAGKHTLLVKYVGNADLVKDITVRSDGELTLYMENAAVNLAEVVVGAQAPDANVQQVQIGVTRLDLKSLQKLPSFLGEADVVQSLLLSPGVSNIGEGATGFNVRGGEVDQNLVMQDEGFVFNSSHALGFFSTFHPDLISNVTLYKSIMPAQYGGRLASVLDVEMRDGNFEKFGIKGNVGFVSSRLAVEGPVVPKKSSFIVGFRSSYSDWILRSVKNLEVRNSSVFFYDANFRYTHRLNDKNLLIISGYASEDDFNYNQEFGFDYQTLMGQLSYKKIFSERLFSQLSATGSRYQSTQFDFTGTDASRLNQDIAYFKLQEQLTYTPSNKVQWNGGISAIHYWIQPGERQPYGALSRVFAKKLETERGLESALFANADWTLTPALQLSGGLRFGAYFFLGAQTVFAYENPQRPDAEAIIDTTFYNKGALIATYTSLEPRLSARYRLSRDVSVKIGYSRTAQFINQIFNTDSPTPTSQFQLSTNYIAPTRSHNFSIGYFQNFKDNLWETSLEVYGRIIDELFDYKDFANLTVNEHLETELLPGTGRAYGAELSIKKNRGRLNGFLSYTLARIERQVPGINEGNWYVSNFDKPHDLSLVLNFQYNQRHTLTLNFAYSTGRPTTAPVGSYQTPAGVFIPIYTERNALRIPDYHRLDFAYTLGRGYRKDKRFKTSWTFSIYNVYGRRNAFSVFFTQTPSTAAQANRLAILGSAFPALTFNFEML